MRRKLERSGCGLSREIDLAALVCATLGASIASADNSKVGWTALPNSASIRTAPALQQPSDAQRFQSDQRRIASSEAAPSPVEPAQDGSTKTRHHRRGHLGSGREVVAGLQAGHDRRDTDIFNRQFAAEVIWGSPYGALIDGYDHLHPIRVRLQEQNRSGPSFRYAVRHTLRVREDVVVAHIARLALGPSGDPRPPTDDSNQAFSEMAMYVLVRRDGQWWLAPGQNTSIRPGGAVRATT